MQTAVSNDTSEENRNEAINIGNIPVRNIWLLMLYASKLLKHIPQTQRSAVEENPDDIPDLIARILSKEVEKRIRRNLNLDHQTRAAALTRVRGRIDLLKTERGGLLDKGKIFCRFNELTVDIPRNRYVRDALDKAAAIARDKTLAHECRSLALGFKRMGVTGTRPGTAAISTDRFGRHNTEDLLMITAARLIFDLALPTESAGNIYLSLPYREKGHWIYNLYEKAVAGFYDYTLSKQNWRVESGKRIKWPVEGVHSTLPSMKTDIILTNKETEKCIVIDTKFNAILTEGWYRSKTLRSGYLYQIYAYLRSQEGNKDSPVLDNACGLLLHPSAGEDFDQSVEIQGHQIRFATVDLSASAIEIKKQLLNVMR